MDDEPQQEPESGVPSRPIPQRSLARILFLMTFSVVPAMLIMRGIDEFMRTNSDFGMLGTWMYFGGAFAANLIWCFIVLRNKERTPDRVLGAFLLAPLLCVVSLALAVPGCFVCLITMNQLS